MKKHRDEIDYITSCTSNSRSLLVSLGYTVELVSEGEDKMEDKFRVYWKGKHVPFYNKKIKEKVPDVRRRQFYQFARRHHPSLRMKEAQRNILHDM